MCFNKKNLQKFEIVFGLIIGIVGLFGVTLYWYRYGFHIEDPITKLNQLVCLCGAFIGIFMAYLININMKLDKLLEKP
jgi:nitrate reductase gamma subunit